MSDYNKHKQRTAVTHLREYIKEATEDKSLETKILEVGDGLAISKVLIWVLKWKEVKKEKSLLAH